MQTIPNETTLKTKYTRKKESFTERKKVLLNFLKQEIEVELKRGISIE